MILIDQIPNFAEIKLNAVFFVPLQTAELFQAECKMDLIDEKNQWWICSSDCNCFTQMDHNS